MALKSGTEKTKKSLGQKLLGAVTAAVIGAILSYIENLFEEELWDKGRQI